MKTELLSIIWTLVAWSSLVGQGSEDQRHWKNCQHLEVFYLNHAEGNGAILDTLHQLVMLIEGSQDASYLLYVSDAYRPMVYWKGMDVSGVFRSLRLSLKDPPQIERDKQSLRHLLFEAMEKGQMLMHFHFFLTMQDLMQIPNERAWLIGELPRELADFGASTGSGLNRRIDLYFPAGALCDLGIERLRLDIYMMEYVFHCLSSK